MTDEESSARFALCAIAAYVFLLCLVFFSALAFLLI